MSEPQPDDISGARESGVVIVGRHSAGKSTIAALMSRATGMPVYELGDVVRQAANGADSLVERAAELLRNDHLFIARTAVVQAGGQGAPPIFVGPRTPQEFGYLCAVYPGALTVGIDADQTLRKKRWEESRYDYSDTWEQREARETEWATDRIVRACEVVVKPTDAFTEKLGLLIASAVSANARSDG